MDRLSDRNLRSLPAAIRVPAYDRQAVRPGIVHLGIGAFHRAHAAVCTDDVLAAGDIGWGIIGASLRSPDTRDALAPQDGLYALDIRSGEGDATRIIGSIGRVMVAPESPEALVAAMADPAIRIVSLTVTEKGYCQAPATGELDEDHPDILNDLAHPEAPRSAPGFIVAALARRRNAGIAPFTVLSCDNLPSNGRTTRNVLARFAALRDADLGLFVADAVHCPSTMVDRIVPATTDDDRARIAVRLGLEDRWPVLAEPFSQWVIEDDFPAGRPAWERGGATFAADVRPFELMKLRLLNGSHSTLAYLGYLAGCETVADAMAEPGIARLVSTLMDHETGPTLPAMAGFDLEAYKASLLARFTNSALRHRTWQIAMDGSQKLPQRLLAPARERLRAGAPIRRIALGIAAWMRYVGGTDEAGRPIDVRDPLANDLRALVTAAGQDADRVVGALLGLRSIFGDDLPSDPRFRRDVAAALAALGRDGAAVTAAAYAAGSP